ncbi:MAG TPA: hypothetical protein VGH54_21585 [Mycobacterium sp.]|uniref:hypothetical protein n=1 Tax=Mycobacterium sp. TaxID=1785 RepID=UPI002F3F0D91
MSTDISLKYLLLGEDRSAGKILKDLAGQSEKTGSNLKRNIVMGAAAAGAAAIAFAKVSVDKFKEVGGETLGLQRIMGGTAEQASRLDFAAKMSGVTYETLAKSTGKLEKGLSASLSSGKATSAMVKTLGFDFRDAQGHIKPMSDLMPQLADKFSHMPAGADKTALAMKLFGKAGADMLPFLNKGSSGIAALEKESDKYGNTLTGKNLDALKQSKASQREWNASLDGLKIQIGAQVLPIMNTMVTFIRSKVIPVIVAITGFMQKHASVVKIVATVLVVLVAGLKAWAIAQRILNAVMATNPIALVVIAIAALAAGLIYAYKHSETFRTTVQTAFAAVKSAIQVMWNVIKPIFDLWKLQFDILAKVGSFLWDHALRPAFQAIIGAFLLVVSTLVHGAASAFGWVPGLGGKLKNAAKQFDGFRDEVNAALKGTTKSVTVSAHVSGAQAVINSLSNVANLMAYIKNGGHVDIGVSGRGTAGFAAGGSPKDGVFTTGENGTELMMKSGSNLRVLSNAQSRHYLAGGGSGGGNDGEATLTVNLRSADGRLMQQELLKVKRTNGGLALGLA